MQIARIEALKESVIQAFFYATVAKGQSTGCIGYP